MVDNLHQPPFPTHEHGKRLEHLVLVALGLEYALTCLSILGFVRFQRLRGPTSSSHAAAFPATTTGGQSICYRLRLEPQDFPLHFLKLAPQLQLLRALIGCEARRVGRVVERVFRVKVHGAVWVGLFLVEHFNLRFKLLELHAKHCRVFSQAHGKRTLETEASAQGRGGRVTTLDGQAGSAQRRALLPSGECRAERGARWRHARASGRPHPSARRGHARAGRRTGGGSARPADRQREMRVGWEDGDV